MTLSRNSKFYFKENIEMKTFKRIMYVTAVILIIVVIGYFIYTGKRI